MLEHCLNVLDPGSGALYEASSHSHIPLKVDIRALAWQSNAFADPACQMTSHACRKTKSESQEATVVQPLARPLPPDSVLGVMAPLMSQNVCSSNLPILPTSNLLAR